MREEKQGTITTGHVVEVTGCGSVGMVYFDDGSSVACEDVWSLANYINSTGNQDIEYGRSSYGTMLWFAPVEPC